MSGDRRELVGEIDLDLLGRVELQFRQAMQARCDPVVVPGFRLFIWSRPDPFYRHVAVPVTSEALESRNIEAMIRAFGAAGRGAKLEFAAECWPALAARLVERGFARESTIPILINRNAERVEEGAGGENVVIVGKKTRAEFSQKGPQELVRTYVNTANRIFNNSSHARLDAEARELDETLALGRSLLGIVSENDEIVAGACLSGIGDDAELAGVWTLPQFRRQGRAQLVCRSLLRRHAECGGGMVWLAAPDPGSRSLYEDLGFRFAGHQLTLALAR